MSSPAPIRPHQITTTATTTERWSSLEHDLLISIFTRLSTADLISCVSAVCSAWRAAARTPRFWRILDLSDWNYITCLIPGYVTFERVFNQVLGFVRECELIEEVYFPRMADGQDLSLVSDRLPNLLYFSFPNAQVPGLMVYSALINFKSLKGIAVFPNFVLSTKIISLLNQYSPDFSELKLFAEKCCLGKDMIMMFCAIICRYLPKLRKLEMPGFKFGTEAILVLLEMLECLEYLDISGCDKSEISKEVIEKASRLKVFIWHS